MIVWTDVETTSLDPKKGHLLEVAMVATDDKLVERGHFSVVVKPVGVEIADIGVDHMPLFVREMHEKSGLLADIEKIGLRRYEARDAIIAWLEKTFGRLADLKQVPLAGSSIGSLDRPFLKEQMSELHELFSHRSIDVSSLTLLADRWSPDVHAHRPKQDRGVSHRALDDARHSIEYLRYYRASGFINVNGSTVIEQAKLHREYFKTRCPFVFCSVCNFDYGGEDRYRGAVVKIYVASSWRNNYQPEVVPVTSISGSCSRVGCGGGARESGGT